MREIDYQEFAKNVVTNLAPVDVLRLNMLSPADREAQQQARSAVYDYVTDLWQQAKRDGKDPANNPGYQGIAALRDILNHLVEHTVMAQQGGPLR